MGNDTFLLKRVDSNFIDLVVSPDPTVIIFAHKTATYVFEESRSVTNAWGPFNASGTYWLYWDIDLLTGNLTRGITQVMPIFSGGLPSNPVNDQHWFDINTTTMKVWNGNKWLEKIRVFAATFTTPVTVTPYPLGSNYPLPAEPELIVDAGNIILDIYNKPIRQSDGTFLTTASPVGAIGYSIQKISFETALLSLQANENIPAYSVVRVKHGRLCELARNSDVTSRVIGIMTEDLYIGEVGNVVPAGLIRNALWSWPATSVGRPVFCGPEGQITTTANSTGVIQQIGYVYDTDAVYIDVKQPIILDALGAGPPPPPPPPPQAPVANFQAVPFVTSGPAPLTVTFNSTSLNGPTTFEWDFTNNGTVDSTSPYPTYTYTQPGTYSVRLKVTNAFGESTDIKTNYITVLQAQSTGTYTNLQAVQTVPGQVSYGQLFPFELLTKNDGAQMATQVARTIQIEDGFTPSSQVLVSGLPPGATTSRSGNVLTVTLPLVSSLVSAGQVSAAFSVTAPATGSQVKVRVFVSSPEHDIESSDNQTTETILLKAP